MLVTVSLVLIIGGW